MTYRRLIVPEYGGPDVLQVVEDELRPPGKGEARIRVLAASVSRPDVTARRGEALYSGTFLGQKTPFTPGYSVVGEVDAIGEGVSEVKPGDRVGALTVTGGYTEVLYRRADRLIPVPTTIDPAQAVPLILNYIVAYQTMHRKALVKAGDTVLIIGASGGDMERWLLCTPLCGSIRLCMDRITMQASFGSKARKRFAPGP